MKISMWIQSLKTLQIDISTQLTKKIWGIQYLKPYPGPSSFSSNKQISQSFNHLIIPVRNLVLLRDHPEGRNKIQDNNKDRIYIITGHHDNCNAYFVKPLGSKCQPKQVNQHEMFDLGNNGESRIRVPKTGKWKKKKTKLANCHCTIQRSQEKKILLNVHII